MEERKQKPKYNMWQNSAYMISIAWRQKEKKVLLLSLLQAIFVVANNLVNLYISPSVLAAVERKAALSELIIIILGFVGLMMLCAAVSAYIGQNVLYGRITVRISIIAALNKKSATTSYPNLGDEKFDKLCTKAGEAVGSNSQATEAIWTTLTTLTQNVMGFVIYLFLLSTLNLWMLILVVATTVIGYFISKQVNGYEYRHREEVAQYEREMWYISGQAKDYGAAKDIRVFGMRPWLEELGDKAMDAYMCFHKRAQNVYIWGKIADLILTFLRNGIAYVYLIHLVLSNGLSAAEFLLYFSAIGGFSSWISGIFADLITLHRQSLDICTVRECLEYPECFQFEEGESLIPDSRKPYEICLEQVSFRYPSAKTNTLSNINLTLHPGEKLAIVGLNGAGKTTLIKLICGFLNPTEGRILLNGQDIREFNRCDYYKMFSAVFQNFSLLAGSIAVNVAQTEENIDMARVQTCVAAAGLRSKVESLPQKYDTLLNREVYEEAVMLSGGETQRLMLARALYKDAPFLVLDEPTAALDPIAEADMYQKYNEMTAGKSSIYISHRLASTRFCDRIIFVEDSVICEEGTHEELLALGGRYAELFEVQSKYYREEEKTNEK